METKKIIKLIFELLDEKKAEDIIALNVSKNTSLADYFVICSGNSEVHNGVLKRELGRHLKEHEIAPYYNDKKDNNNSWLVLDYGEIIIHIFTPDCRNFYNIEGMWGNLKAITP